MADHPPPPEGYVRKEDYDKAIAERDFERRVVKEQIKLIDEANARALSSWRAALMERPAMGEIDTPVFMRGDYVRKRSGSWWEGRVVGLYSTEQTPNGVAVQLVVPGGNGPVQIYPAAAMEACDPSTSPAALLDRAPAQEAVGWQPIETAPRDGWHILARFEDSDTCYVICWADRKRGIRAEICGNDDRPGWRHAWDGYFFEIHEQPTVWQPLPAAPSPPEPQKDTTDARALHRS